MGVRLTGIDRIRAGATGVAVVATLLLLFVPAPYVIEQPGPVFDTLGTAKSADGKTDVPLVTTPAASSFPTTGALDMLTVRILGGPGQSPNWLSVLIGVMNPTETVLPMEVYYPPGQTVDQRNQQSAAEMTDSQQEAIAAALTNLGYRVAQRVRVGAVSPGLPADGVLKVGDIVTAVNGTPVSTGSDVVRLTRASGAGVPVTFDIERDGKATSVRVTPIVQNGVPVVGLRLVAAFQFPIDVKIMLNDVGGPSAGMMFALAIIDKLTAGAMTGGKKIAGTGTIDASGRVGAIGGIRQKMYAAVAAGATFFLAPADNCREAVGSVPGLRVFKVATLAQARQTVEAIGSGADLSSFPTCSK